MIKLKQSLKSLSRLATPDRAYKRALWLNLSSAFDQEYRREGARLHWKLATAPIVALVVILLTGTGVYAFESPRVSTGHPLYPLKQRMENMHHAFFVRGEADEEKFQQWVTNRRMSEIRTKAEKLPMELRQQILELKASIDAQELGEEEKRELFRAEVQALLNQ